MVITHKLAAIAVSTTLLLGGGTAAIVSATAVPEAAVVIATPEPVTSVVRVVADGTTHSLSLASPTVAQALGAVGVNLNATDRTDRPLDSVMVTGDAVTVSRVTVTQESKVVTVDFSTVRKNDAALERGKTKVETKGEPGERTDLVETVTVNGEIESQNVLSSSTTREPVTQVVLVGTKAPQVTSRSTTRTTPTAGTTSGAGINLANAAMWDRIAQCESTGNWSINTGNGYYGGLQFSLASWKANGGTDFAAYPHQASRAEQITVANRYYAKAGLQPWGCRSAA